MNTVTDGRKENVRSLIERGTDKNFLRVKQIHHDGKDAPNVGTDTADNVFGKQVALHGRLTQPINGQRLLMQH